MVQRVSETRHIVIAMNHESMIDISEPDMTQACSKQTDDKHHPRCHFHVKNNNQNIHNQHRNQQRSQGENHLMLRAASRLRNLCIQLQRLVVIHSQLEEERKDSATREEHTAECLYEQNLSLHNRSNREQQRE